MAIGYWIKGAFEAGYIYPELSEDHTADKAQLEEQIAIGIVFQGTPMSDQTLNYNQEGYRSIQEQMGWGDYTLLEPEELMCVDGSTPWQWVLKADVDGPESLVVKESRWTCVEDSHTEGPQCPP